MALEYQRKVGVWRSGLAIAGVTMACSCGAEQVEPAREAFAGAPARGGQGGAGSTSPSSGSGAVTVGSGTGGAGGAGEPASHCGVGLAAACAAGQPEVCLRYGSYLPDELETLGLAEARFDQVTMEDGYEVVLVDADGRGHLIDAPSTCLQTEAPGVVVEAVVVRQRGEDIGSLDWFVQDVSAEDTAEDPACVDRSLRGEQSALAPALYLRTDAESSEGRVSFRARAFNPESSGTWEDRAVTTFDWHAWTDDITAQPGHSVGDIFEAMGDYTSIVGTDDAGGEATGWLGSGGDGCEYQDGWLLYHRTDWLYSTGRNVRWRSAKSPITGVTAPTAASCPAVNDVATASWTHYLQFDFAADSTCTAGRKRLDTFVVDHDGGTHHEVFYFTDEYGFTRWERWGCQDEELFDYPGSDYAQARCRYDVSTSVMHRAYGEPYGYPAYKIRDPDGQYCYLADCRDSSEVVPMPEPGWLPAARDPGAQVLFLGNLLANGSFGDDEVTGVMGSFSLEKGWDDNQYLRLDGPGSFVAQGDLAPVLELEPKGTLHLHWGAKVAREGGGRLTASVRQLSEGAGEVGRSALTFQATADWTHVNGSVELQSDASAIEVTWSWDGSPGSPVSLDDVYAVVRDEP